ncbi:MAG: DUF6049 family protein [Lacisediminihabitans sp.]
MPVRLLSPLLALAMAAVGLALPAAALPTVDVPAVPSALTVVAAPLQFGALAPGEDLIIASSVTNDTPSAVSGAIITVSLQRRPVASVSALTSWMHPPADEHHVADTVLLQQPLPELPRGETRTDSLIVPAAAVGLDGQPWGVHALSVTVTAASVDDSHTRTSIVWHPAAAVPATSVAVVAPITVPTEAVGLLDAAHLAVYTAPGGVLDRQLSGLVGSQVAIGIDPRIIASIRILGTEAPPSATAWLERLRTAGNETFGLSYADSDIAALAQSGGIPPLDPITFPIDPTRFAPTPSGSPQPSPSPTFAPSPSATPVPTLPTSKELLDWNYTIPAIAWPGDNTVVDKNLDRFAEAGLTTTILSSDNLAAANPGAISPVMTSVGGHPVAVASSALSALLREAVGAADDLSWRDAVSEFSSMLALAGAEGAEAPGTVLVTLGREAPATTFRLAQTVAALQTLPWAPQTTLSQALSAAGPSTSLVPKPEKAKRLGLVKAMLDSEGAVGQFSSVLTDPTLVTGPRRLALLAVLSHNWDSASATWADTAAKYVSDSQTVTSSISIVEGSPINLVAENGNLPIAVSNRLDHPVTVYVSVRPQRAILNVMKNNVALTIEAKSQSRALIPVQSVANGQVLLGVSLASATGVQISLPAVVEVNVQADWEKLATGIIAGLLVAVFGFGIWRNIAKRRRARREPTSTRVEATELHE